MAALPSPFALGLEGCSRKRRASGRGFARRAVVARSSRPVRLPSPGDHDPDPIEGKGAYRPKPQARVGDGPHEPGLRWARERSSGQPGWACPCVQLWSAPWLCFGPLLWQAVFWRRLWRWRPWKPSNCGKLHQPESQQLAAAAPPHLVKHEGSSLEASPIREVDRRLDVFAGGALSGTALARTSCHLKGNRRFRAQSRARVLWASRTAAATGPTTAFWPTLEHVSPSLRRKGVSKQKLHLVGLSFGALTRAMDPAPLKADRKARCERP